MKEWWLQDMDTWYRQESLVLGIGMAAVLAPPPVTHTYSPAQFRTGPGPGHIDVSRTADRGGNQKAGLCHLGNEIFETFCEGLPMLGTCERETTREPHL